MDAMLNGRDRHRAPASSELPLAVSALWCLHRAQMPLALRTRGTLGSFCKKQGMELSPPFYYNLRLCIRQAYEDRRMKDAPRLKLLAARGRRRVPQWPTERRPATDVFVSAKNS